ncbi:MAG: sulfate/thiosulfate import ATP-binding protein CysA [Planctomycetota bacterium]|jgi:sulfate transport system ATP-binding protein
MSITVQRLTKRFGSFTALDDVSLELPSGELTALLGPSGSGKTTLLRIIAGMEVPDSGQVLFSGQDATHVSPAERGVGFVFQHYALFRHMSIFDNVAFGLTVKKGGERPGKAEIAEKVHRLLKMVQLDWCADRFPHQLSGGQRQRIALARALAVEPKVLLLDEPFGALDTKVRTELRRWLRRLHDEMHITSVFVTHDQEEAMEVSDRVVVINQGKVEQYGTPADIYETPANPFVFQFIGHVNLFRGRVHKGWAEVGGVAIPTPEHDQVDDHPAVAYVRPHDVSIHRTDPGAGAVKTVIRHVHAIGPMARIELEPDPTGGPVEAHIPTRELHELKIGPGDTIWISPRKATVFLDAKG